MKPWPSAKELKVATILSDFFKADVAFVERNNNKTPDFLINEKYWELKSPVGNGARTIDNVLRDATKQSDNIVLDLSFCKMNQQRAIARAKRYISVNSRGISRLIIIKKDGGAIDIFDVLG